MISKGALSHTAKSADCYANDRDTLHIRLRTGRGDVAKVVLLIGDPYRWQQGGLDGGNLGGGEAAGWSGGQQVLMQREGRTEYHDHWFAEFIPPKRRCRYGFILHGADGNERLLFGEKRCVDIREPHRAEAACSDLGNLFAFPYLNPIDVLDTPDWVERTVWYQIFPERFANGRPEISPPDVKPWGTRPSSRNFMGGDLWGVLEKLDYLQELGINGLYFCPIFTANANHKYDTVDYFNVDPHFGGNEAFKALVDAAHKRGMRIILDAVFNHVGDQFPLWLDVVKHGDKSVYRDWFWVNNFPVYPDTPRNTWNGWQLNYETFGTVAAMPKLNTEHPECRAYLLDVARHWMTEFDIDGWRLDVANEVDHQFWRAFRDVVKGVKPDSYILGEIWHQGMPWLRGDQFDSLMNYPLTAAIIDYFAVNSLDKQGFMDDVSRAYLSYPRNVNRAIFNLLDSHDTPRILTLCGNDVAKVKLAYLFMFTQCGSPCIYYGGEIGMRGEKHMGVLDNRRCMIWDPAKQDHGLKNFIRQLITWRNRYSGFHSPTIRWLETQSDTTLAYQKENMVVVINNADHPQQVTLPERFDRHLINIESGKPSARHFDLAPRGFQVLCQG